MNDLINNVLGFLPEKWRGPAVALVAASPYLTRAFYAIKNGGGIKGIFTAIWLGTNTPKPAAEQPSTASKAALSVALLASLGLGALLLSGCAGGGKLAPGGFYAPTAQVVSTNDVGVVSTNVVATAAPDMALYTLDASFELSASAIQAAFKIERDNRALLWQVSPDIKHSLDKIRPASWEVISRYTLAREIYLKSRTPANLSAVNEILHMVQSLSVAAQAAIQPATATSVNQ